MSEKIIGIIYAGSSPVYEIIENEKKVDIIFRLHEKPEESFSIPKTAIPDLIRILNTIKQ